MCVRKLGDYLVLTIGTLCTAAGLSLFLIPHHIAAGGISGLATILAVPTKVSVGFLLLIGNALLLLVGFRFLGSVFGAKTVFCSLLLSLGIELFDALPPMLVEPLLATLYGGSLAGIGMGIVFRVGGSTGGTDILAKLVFHRFPTVSVGRFLLGLDSLIIAIGILVFRDLSLALYSVLAIVICTLILDLIVEGSTAGKAILIVSEKAEIIAERMMCEGKQRGVTGLYSQGMYTKRNRLTLFCVTRKREVYALKKIVYELDPDALFFLLDAREVSGNGF
ncbi:MAG: YitT family protein [Clostridia bacterium]|nr:YitT family protein [Clostridia bacterium]